MTTITISGAAIQRYKIGYHSDEWGVRSSTPGGICDDAGPWVRYEDAVAEFQRLHAYCQELEAQVIRDCMSIQQPAPAGASYEKALEEALRERDDADDFIDALLDEVLGTERAEWSSAYGRAEALEEVRERITALHKPAVDRAWKHFEVANQQAEVRPVTPYTCPKCHALWLHWPAEQTGFGRDTLNCRSADHCHYCEKAGVEQLQRLERTPAALHAPQPSPTAQPAPATQAVSDDLRDRLVAISEAIANQDDRAAQAMLMEILKAPQADSQPAPQQEAQEPVAGQCRFPGAVWSECSPEHVRMVLANPEEWKRYEARYLYTAPQPVERELLTDEQWQRIADLTNSILTRATKDEIERVIGIKGGQNADT